MDTEHFQAPFGVIIFGSIQIEKSQIEKPSTKELTAWLLSKLHVIKQPIANCRLKIIIQTERFRESSSKRCKTATLEKIWELFGLPLWRFVREAFLHSFLQKKLNIFC